MIKLINYSITTLDGKPVSGCKNCRNKIFSGIAAYRAWESKTLIEAERANGKTLTILVVKTLKWDNLS